MAKKCKEKGPQVIYRLECWEEAVGCWLCCGYWRSRESADAYTATRDGYYRTVAIPLLRLKSPLRSLDGSGARVLLPRLHPYFTGMVRLFHY